MLLSFVKNYDKRLRYYFIGDLANLFFDLGIYGSFIEMKIYLCFFRCIFRELSQLIGCIQQFGSEPWGWIFKTLDFLQALLVGLAALKSFVISGLSWPSENLHFQFETVEISCRQDLLLQLLAVEYWMRLCPTTSWWRHRRPLLFPVAKVALCSFRFLDWNPFLKGQCCHSNNS